MNARIKKTFQAIFFVALACILSAGYVLFGTSYGHQLRTIAAQSILTSQHRQWAKFTLLPQSELDSLLQAIENPNWKNSSSNNISTAEETSWKQDNVKISIDTIEKKYSDHYFTGKLMTVNDPLSVKLVTQEGTLGENRGETIDVMAERYHAAAAVNASGFADKAGDGGGASGLGIVIANGEIVNTPGSKNTSTIIAGLTKDGQMITGNYSANQLLQHGVVSAAGFMPQLIVNGEKMITDGNGGWGYGPRTIMAQKKDGTILFLVVDGRQSHSIGASLKDCQDLLYDLGAYNAMAMDGGASSVIYASGSIINIPATPAHHSRYLPNCWIITAKPGQQVEMTIDGKQI